MVQEFEYTTTTTGTTTEVQPEVPAEETGSDSNSFNFESAVTQARDKISHWVDFLKNLLHFDQLTVISVDSGTMKSE